jgi:hypothetical protein
MRHDNQNGNAGKDFYGGAGRSRQVPGVAGENPGSERPGLHFGKDNG